MTVTALAGGVGGAKLAAGLQAVLPRGELTVIVNTGDDFDHLGMRICPDLDTVMYTLAGINNPETGWGLAGETWEFLGALERLGGDAWFRLGDRDLAVHVERTRRLADGQPLSRITAGFCAALGIAAQVLPMSDSPVRTLVHTAAGTLPFQDYFVRQRCEPVVTGFAFDGAEYASANFTLNSISQTGLSAIVICPSNPYVSIGPILALPGVREQLLARTAPAVAVSPIVGGQALKGPAAKMMTELGHVPSAGAVAQFYGGLLDGFVIDRADAPAADSIRGNGVAVLVADTVMTSAADRARLAAETLAFAATLSVRKDAG